MLPPFVQAVEFLLEIPKIGAAVLCISHMSYCIEQEFRFQFNVHCMTCLGTRCRFAPLRNRLCRLLQRLRAKP